MAEGILNGNGVRRPEFSWRINLGQLLNLLAVALLTGVVTLGSSMRTDIDALKGDDKEREAHLLALDKALDAEDRKLDSYIESNRREAAAYQTASQASTDALKELLSQVRVGLARLEDGKVPRK